MTLTPSRSLIIRAVVFIVVFVFAAWALISQWSAFTEAASALGFTTVALSMVAAIGASLTTAMAWTMIVRGLGAQLPLQKGLTFFLAGQLGKYVPGGVGPVVAQGALNKFVALPRRAILQAYLLLTLETVATGVVVGAGGVALASVGSDTQPLQDFWWILIPLPLVFLLLHPSALRFVGGIAGRLLGRSIDLPPTPLRSLLAAGGWTLCTWAFFGLHLFVIAAATDQQSPGLLLASVGAFALAWTAGFVVVVAPAGLGVRELILGAVLAPIIGIGPAAAAAVVSRIILTITDVVTSVSSSVLLGASWSTRVQQPNPDLDPPA